MSENIALSLEMLISQAQSALEQLDKEPIDRTQARIRVMTATIQDLRIYSKVDALNWID